jgi:hypothetical protein
MHVAEVREPGADLRLVEREMPEPGPGKVPASDTATPSPSRDTSPASTTLACPVMRSRVVLTRSATASPSGKSASALASAGMAVIAACV